MDESGVDFEFLGSLVLGHKEVDEIRAQEILLVIVNEKRFGESEHGI